MAKTLAGYIASVREKMRDEPTSSNTELDLEDGEIIGHILSAVEDISMVVPRVANAVFTLYECEDDDYFVDDEDISSWSGGEAATLLYNTLSPARNITFKFTDDDLSITAFTLTIVGKDARGTAQTEVFYWINGLEQTSGRLWSYVTSVTATAITGAGTGDTLRVGFGKYVHNGFSINASGPTTMLDISSCRDNYSQEYFKDLIGVRSVEYPINTDTSGARGFRTFELYGPILDIQYDSALEEDENIRLVWSGKHIVTYDTSTIPANLEEVVLVGALAHAFSSIGSRKIDMVNIGGAVASQIRDIALIKREEFAKKLKGAKPVRINKSFSTE